MDFQSIPRFFTATFIDQKNMENPLTMCQLGKKCCMRMFKSNPRASFQVMTEEPISKLQRDNLSRKSCYKINGGKNAHKMKISKKICLRKTFALVFFKDINIFTQHCTFKCNTLHNYLLAMNADFQNSCKLCSRFLLKFVFSPANKTLFMNFCAKTKTLQIYHTVEVKCFERVSLMH